MRRVLAIAAALGLSAASMANAASPRIVNGVETAEFPTVGVLLDADGEPVTQHNAEFACTGVLIGCRTVLTAAHCVEYFGPGRLAFYLQHAGFLPVSEFRFHPDYDLAVLRLAAPVNGIVPSTLNTTHDLEQLGAGFEGTIVGFGRTGGDNYDWEYEYGIKRSGGVVTASCDPELNEGANDNEFVCWNFADPIGEPGENSSTCHGDSGGPLFLDFGGSLELAGVTYGGSEDHCLPPTQALDVSVFHHAAWIEDQLEGDSTEACGGGPLIGSALTPVHAESGTLGPAHPVRTFRIPLRDDTSRVLVTVNGSVEDYRFNPDLFVKVNGDASAISHDCAVIGDSEFAACELESPGAGYLSVLIAARYNSGLFQATVVEHNEEASVCGNGVLEMGEQCDTSQLGTCPLGPCRQDCTCKTPVCGNGTLETGERCDDGNTGAGDGCNAACVPEMADDCEDAPVLALTPGLYTLLGNTTGLGDSHVGCGSKAGDAWYRFTLAERVTFAAETDGAFLSALTLFHGDCSGFSYRHCDYGDGAARGASLRRLQLDPGSYILVVDGGQRAEGPFELSISVATPGCGNGVADYYEQCDGLDEGSCGDGVCGADCRCAHHSCGNDVREHPEQCDGTDLGICGTGPCTDDCRCPEPVCGNGVLEESAEECDGFDQWYASCRPDLCDDQCRCQESVCGDGIRTSDEYCDGEVLGLCKVGPCAADCTCPDAVCGNDIRENFEACDGSDIGNCQVGPCTIDCNCPAAVCGNDTLEFGEHCDGTAPNTCTGGVCEDDCTCPDPFCGNDVRESGEQCDGQDIPFCVTGTCTPACTCPAPVCGNGVRENNEDCDGSGFDYCWVGDCQQDCTCPEPVCGNGILEFNEACDGPNLDFCHTGPCESDCDCPPSVCGDGVWDQNGEECDGLQLGYCEAGPCANDCSCPEPECGNDIREDGEQCDGPDTWGCQTGSCESDCTCSLPVCGDGQVHYPEGCESNDTAHCFTAGPCQQDCSCAPAVCGNGILESGEYCDGSHLDGCQAGPCSEDCTCPAPVCGNGILEEEETCDGTHLRYCPVGPCTEDCECPEPVCGNSVIEPGETCDGTKRGTCVAGPCDDDCTCPAPVCGNNLREDDEDCDGVKQGFCLRGPCDGDCTCPDPVCGDEMWEYPAEECDPSSESPQGYCQFGPCGNDCSCPPAVCGNGVVEGDEECDGDGSITFDRCDTVDCEDDCECAPHCGDGEVNGDEECEYFEADQCASGECTFGTCTCVPLPGCGDSEVQEGEQCDGASLGECPIGPCRNNCRCPNPVCGNGVFEARESCEPSDAGYCGEQPCQSDCTCEGPSGCGEAEILPGVLSDHGIDGTTVDASNSSIGCGGTSGEKWFALDVSDYSIFEAATEDGLDTEVSLFAGTCGSLAFVGCDDDSGPGVGSHLGPVILKPGKYFLILDGHGSEEGEFTLTVDLEKWDCCDADGNGTVTAGDALRVLRKGVGQPQVCPITRCDPGGDRQISAVDALLVLKTSVGIVVDLQCPAKL